MKIIENPRVPYKNQERSPRYDVPGVVRRAEAEEALHRPEDQRRPLHHDGVPEPILERQEHRDSHEVVDDE